MKTSESALPLQDKDPSNETARSGFRKPSAPRTCPATREVNHTKGHSIRNCTYQRQESPSYPEGNLSKGDLRGEGGVKVEAVLRPQGVRQSHSSVVVLQVQVQVQVQTLHLSFCYLVRRIELLNASQYRDRYKDRA